MVPYEVCGLENNFLHTHILTNQLAPSSSFLLLPYPQLLNQFKQTLPDVISWSGVRGILLGISAPHEMYREMCTMYLHPCIQTCGPIAPHSSLPCGLSRSVVAVLRTSEDPASRARRGFLKAFKQKVTASESDLILSQEVCGSYARSWRILFVSPPAFFLLLGALPGPASPTTSSCAADVSSER